MNKQHQQFNIVICKLEKVRMKIQLKSVLKSHFNKFRCVDQNQVIHPAGNNLRILQINKSDAQFISLHKQNTYLYDFAVSPNSKHIFTAEKINNGVEVCSYGLTSERKMIRLSEGYNFLSFDTIESISLLTDEFQSSVVYVICKAKAQATISLIDMLRLKIVSHGFLSEFNQATVCSQETYEISVCGRNFVRRLRATDGSWSVQQKQPKKLINTQIFHHTWLPLGRCLMATKTQIFIIQDGEIIQNFNITQEDDPIFHIFNIAKGFIIICDKGKIKIFGQEGDDSLYTQLQQLKLSIQKSKVSQIQYNKKTQQIYISTSNGKYYRSRLQETTAAGKQNYFNFQQINIGHSHPQSGSVTTAAGQNYCLISSQKNVQLWDMVKLCPTICLQVSNLGQDKVVKSSAIAPDGHSLCIGFSDRVRFYRILLNKFRQFGEYPIKNTTLIHYSHGGQLVAVIHGKGTNSSLSIVNTLNLRQVMNFKIGFKAAQAIWNQHDDQLYISGQDVKVISIYQISSKSKKCLIQFDSEITFIRFDYLTRKIMVSTGNQIHLIDSQHKTETIIKPKIQNFDYVFPVQGLYIAADKKGGLYCSNNPQFQKYQFLPIFLNQRFHLLYKREMLIAYSSPANVIILKLKSSADQNKHDVNENVVLVDKDEIDKFFDRVKLLQGQLQQLQTSTSMKLDYERKKSLEQLQAQQKKFKQQITELQNKLSFILVQKSRQQKSNAKVFDELETGQLKSVNDLQKVYDMKLRMQKQKCLTLQQQKLEQKMKYQKIIEDLREKHNNHVQKIRKQYSEDLKKQLKQMQNQKQRYNQYRKKVQTKLIDIQQEGQMALFQVQLKKDDKIKNLTQRFVKLERQYDSKVIALHNMEEELQKMIQKDKQSSQYIQRNKIIIKENTNKVMILEKQIEKKNRIVQEKNAIIEQQAHQIDGLQKAKYVLSFRTTQVRKQLEPKQTLIQKLKIQMFKLDEQYKNEVKRSYQLSQRVQKLQKMNVNYKKQNGDLKTQLKSKERVHNDLCSQIFLLVNNTDAKLWNSALVKIYQHYIKEDKIKVKTQKKQDSTSQEINRHLIHVEQSLHQVATGNQKMLKGKQQQVIRKMKENAELVYDLNIMRKKQNQYLNDIKTKDTQISRLKRQLNQSIHGHKSTRANTANTGMTRRLASRDAVNQNNSDWVDLSIKRQSDYLLPDKSKKGRVFSAHKTMVWRQESRKQKTKIIDMARELESAKNTIMRQDRMIEELNQRLLGIPQQQLQ